MKKKLEDASWQDPDLQPIVRRQMAAFLQWAVDNGLAAALHVEARQALLDRPEHYIRHSCDDSLGTDDFVPEAAQFVANVYAWERADSGTWNLSGLNRRLRAARPFEKNTPRKATPNQTFPIGSLVRHPTHGVGTVRVLGSRRRVGVRFEGAKRALQVPVRELEAYSLRAAFLDAAAADPGYADDPMAATRGLGGFLLWAHGKGLVDGRRHPDWAAIRADATAYVVEACGGALDVEDFQRRAQPFVLTAMPRYGEEHPPEEYDRRLRRRPIPS